MIIFNKFLLLLTLISSASGTFADVLFLINGDRITGQIMDVDGASVTIKPAYSDKLNVMLDDVATLETDIATEIELSDGTVGKFQITAGGQAGKATLVAAEQAVDVTLAEIERFGEKLKPETWGATLDLSSTFNRGNTDSQDANFQWRANYQRGQHRYKSDLKVSREEEDGTITKEKDRVKIGYNRLFDNKWFFALDSAIERDPIADLDHRLSITPAVGYAIWNDDRRTLNFQLGGGYAVEKSDGQDESTSNLDWKLEVSYKLRDDEITLFHRHNVYRNISGRENTVLEAETGVRYKLLGNLHVNVQANYDYDTQPVDGAESKDLEILIGAGLSF
jgi:putative salt-induced outer membrane protein YdiY